MSQSPGEEGPVLQHVEALHMVMNPLSPSPPGTPVAWRDIPCSFRIDIAPLCLGTLKHTGRDQRILPGHTFKQPCLEQLNRVIVNSEDGHEPEKKLVHGRLATNQSENSTECQYGFQFMSGTREAICCAIPAQISWEVDACTESASGFPSRSLDSCLCARFQSSADSLVHGQSNSSCSPPSS